MGSPLCLHWLMLFLDTLRRTGYKIVHLNRRYVDDIMMLFYLPRQNIQKPYEIFQMVDILTCHLQLKVKSKAECPFSMYRLFLKIKRLPLLPTVNLPLVELIHILTAFYYLPISLVLFTYSLIDPCKFAQVGLNYTINQFVEKELKIWLPLRFYK